MAADILAIALGLAVGLSLGALGGGGSTLAVPILVFVAGLSAQDATSASLLVVGVASAIGVWGHFRNGNVRLGTGIAFGAAGIVGNRAGTLLNRSMDEQVLLLAFSGLILFVAVRMYRSIGRKRAVHGAAGSLHCDDDADNSDGVPGSCCAPGSVMVENAALVAAPRHVEMSVRSLTKLAIAATLVGLLTGLFGVGGGFAVVPALTLLLGFEAKEAIGTSLVVIAINASLALAMRSGDLGFDWALVVPFLATVTVGVLVGSAVAHQVEADKLTRGFSVMLVIVGVYTAVSTLLT